MSNGNRYLVVKKLTGRVTNAVVWNGVDEFSLEDAELISVDDAPEGAWIGWTLSNGEWSAPVKESTEEAL